MGFRVFGDETLVYTYEILSKSFLHRLKVIETLKDYEINLATACNLYVIYNTEKKPTIPSKSN